MLEPFADFQAKLESNRFAWLLPYFYIEETWMDVGRWEAHSLHELSKIPPCSDEAKHVNFYSKMEGPCFWPMAKPWERSSLMGIVLVCSMPPKCTKHSAVLQQPKQSISNPGSPELDKAVAKRHPEELKPLLAMALGAFFVAHPFILATLLGPFRWGPGSSSPWSPKRGFCRSTVR